MNNIVPGSFQLMKKINTGLILDTIRSKGPISRADIARFLNLTPATVTNITSELINSNIIMEGELGESSGGRKPIMLMINTHENYIISVQLDLNLIRVAILNMETQILDEISRITDNSLDTSEFEQLIISTIHEILDRNSIEKSKILGLGAGINGIIDYQNGEIVSSPVLKLENIRLRYILESEFDVPVYIDRDVRTMALGESWFGEGVGIESFICIKAGSSICASFVNNKQIIRGISGGLGEIGQMIISSDGPSYGCGKKGCLDSLASEKAILHYAFENGFNDTIDISTIHKKSLDGNIEAINAIEKAGTSLGIGIANLINTFNPELILVGGGLADINDYYFNAILNSAKENSIKQLFDFVKIKRALTKNDAILKGTGVLVLDNLFDALNQ